MTIRVAQTVGCADSTEESFLTGVTPLRKEEIYEAAALQGLVEELGVPSTYMLKTGGKNLRSTMVLQCAQIGPRGSDPIVRVGATAVEFVHLATLAHDDVVDDGKVRRGVESVGAAYGSITAGFVGGMLFARAGELIAGCGPAPTLRFARAAAEVCEGQMMELEDLFDLDRSLQRYRLAISGKTGSLFELSAWLGATLGGASEQTAEELARFGREFGVAFQLADDILDLVAPEEEMGKMRGKDLHQGVYTSPALHAMTADPTLRGVLAVGSEPEDLPSLIERIERAGGIERGIEECFERAERARATLRGLASEKVGRQLGLLVDSCLERIPRAAVSGIPANA